MLGNPSKEKKMHGECCEYQCLERGHDECMSPQVKKLIVTRHPGALEWLREQLPDFGERTVLTSATEEDVKQADVVGNLPMSLASQARRFRAIEFDGPPPRGAEYGAKEMYSAGARLAEYVVLSAYEADHIEEVCMCGPHIRRWTPPASAHRIQAQAKDWAWYQSFR